MLTINGGILVCREYAAIAILDQVKRSDSNFPADFSSLYQKLTETVNFCVGRFVGHFIGRVHRLGRGL
jgi:hypothetical protein